MTAVASVVPEFATVFPFDSFNRMQRAALPAILERDENVVVSAPTASGKTALAELAICRTLSAGGTALFLAPLRALTNEKEREWERFEALGYSVYVVTGERDLNPRRAALADVLVMTPEKADSATRKHETSRYEFVTDVDCCVVDEVHLLDSASRGPCLEVTVSRLRRLCDPRIVALSATMPNVEAVAKWLDAPPETTFKFGDAFRPVPLHAGVETYAHGENAFADKYRRLYRALDLAQPHVEDGGQALVFVASRQDTVQAATTARDELADRDVSVGDRGEYAFHADAAELTNDTLRSAVLDGVAFHHAGLAKGDRDRVEQWFREGRIGILFSTTTLAWGVNLPARCVVVRDTKLHDPLEGEIAMSPLDLLQMLGRAGRPGYDETGYAYVVCDTDDADRYRELLREGTPIESQLAADLAGHLNAEIALGTIADLAGAMRWLETTFYAVSATPTPARVDGESDRRDRMRTVIDDLVDQGFVRLDAGGQLSPTDVGRLTSQFYLEIETAAAFASLAERIDGSVPADPGDAAGRAISDGAGGSASPSRADQLLRSVATAAEFDRVTERKDERAAIRTVIGPAGEDLAPGNRKVLAILQAAMTGSTPAPLRSDAWIIRQNALRLLGALQAFLDRFGTPRTANLARRLVARIETGIEPTAIGLTAIDGIGARRASRLAEAGLRSPADVRAAGVEGLLSAGLADGVAERILANADRVPVPIVDWGPFPDRIGRGEHTLCEVDVGADGDDHRAAVRVTVEGREMTAKTTHLGHTTVPVAVFGGDADHLEYAIEIVYPDLPLSPYVERRTVTID